MEHSKKFDTVKRYCNLGMWDDNKVKNAVLKGWITAVEYKEIVGRDYE